MHGEPEAIKCVSDGRGLSEPDRPGAGGAGSTGRSGAGPGEVLASAWVGLGAGLWLEGRGGELGWEQRAGWGWERPGEVLPPSSHCRVWSGLNVLGYLNPGFALVFSVFLPFFFL